MSTITYVVGDVREPIGNGKKMIVHCCNDLGKMGSGVALAILNKWPKVREDYIRWHKTGQTMVFDRKDGFVQDGSFKLGNVQFIRVVVGELLVINMIAQHDIVSIDGIPPIRYDAMKECLKKVYEMAYESKASVHIPYKMGCDRAGGSWDIVEKMIIEELCDKDIDVTVYDIDDLRGVQV